MHLGAADGLKRYRMSKYIDIYLQWITNLVYSSVIRALSAFQRSPCFQVFAFGRPARSLA